MMRRTLIPTLKTPFRTRALSTTPITPSAWSTGPSPPRLPKDEQEIYEQLTKQSTGAFSTPSQPTSKPRTAPQINQSPQSTTTTKLESQPREVQAEGVGETLKANVQTGKGEELHPNIRRGAPPEFEGDINPKTGEVGGPKNEPLRWGNAGDWSYNGRATDF